MKNYLLKSKFSFLLLILPFISNAQLGVNSDNSAPSSNSMLDVTSSTKGILIPRVASDLGSPTEGLLYYNTTGHNFRYYDGTAWQNALFGSQWNVNGTKISYSLGNVGIGVADPQLKFDVLGDSRFTGWVAINDSYPDYPLDVNGLASIQYVGIGGATPNTITPLTVTGNAEFNNNIHVDGTTILDGTVTMMGNANIGGAATVNGGGVAYNLLSDNNIKIARFVTPIPAQWGTGDSEYPIPAHGSREITIDLPPGFTGTPVVMVASEHSTFGAVGELYRTILKVYNCNTTQCTGKIINTDNSAIDYWVRWNLVAMQF